MVGGGGGSEGKNELVGKMVDKGWGRQSRQGWSDFCRSCIASCKCCTVA